MTVNLHSIRDTKQITGPKILLWDIEKCGAIVRFKAYQLKLYTPYIDPKHIERDGWIPCAAWSWLDDPYVAAVSVLNDPERFKKDYSDDYHVVKTLWSVLNEADIIVAHNGDNFDWKEFTARCIKHNLEPPSKPVMIDTLKVARKEFKFTSNKLSYLAEFLGVELKDEAPDWDLVDRGDPDEIAKAVKYCMRDVRSLKGVYLRLRPYITNHPHIGHRGLCPKCRHWDITIKKTQRLKCGKTYKQMRCSIGTGGCGSYFPEHKAFK